MVSWMEEYRLRDSIRAVKFDADGHGRVALLSPGCVVQIGGTTPLRGFIEIICNGQSYSVFREDLEDRCDKITHPAEE